MTHVEIATSFASLGYQVFPLYRGRNNEKLKPYGWANNPVDVAKLDKVIAATSDPKEIAAWPDQVRLKYRSEVVGFGVLGTGCVILDLDIKGGKDGFNEFSKLCQAYNVPLSPMATITKSGGLHLYYQRPKKYKDVALKTISGLVVGNIKCPSIDLRGDGGFVVGPEVLVEDIKSVPKGQYGMRGLQSPDKLPLFPETLVSKWIRPRMDEDLENLASLAAADEENFKTQIRKGVIPELIPKGARNESFFVFINVLKSRNVPREVARQMCYEMAKRVEEPETLAASVDIEAMLNKAYELRMDNPHDVAVDLIQRGLFQVVGHKAHLQYIILEDNPYISSKNLHDETSMKTLLMKYQRQFTNEKGKQVTLNPMQVVTKIIGDENRVDTVGFKPNAGEVFSLHDEPGSKRFLNTYRPIVVTHREEDLDDQVWAEFLILISRIFGPEGSDEYQLGLDFVSWLIQKPQIKPSISPFIMSTKRGVGKSLFFNVVVQILGTAKTGDRQARIVKLDEITGRFFDPSGCIINLIDEVQFSIYRDMRKDSTLFWRHLKNLITAETVPVEIKGGSTYQCVNSAAVALAGNFGCNFPIEEFDRRLWIIDANPPYLERGTVDKLFKLVKRNFIGADDRMRLISTLRYRLMKHEIKMDLSSMRAPMTEIKQEMYENSLPDLEEWFVIHFKDPANTFAFTPVISQSALMYVYEQSGRYLQDSNSLTVFRDLKRKGFIRPIRTSGGAQTSRQFNVPGVAPDGSFTKAPLREILYTTRDHGELDDLPSSVIIERFMQNCATIRRTKKMDEKREVSGKDLLGR